MNDYLTLTELGRLYGVSSHVVGKWLKGLGLRCGRHAGAVGPAQRLRRPKSLTECVTPRRKIIQFNWRRNWSKKVVPHLQKELVQVSLDVGMMALDPTWRRGDAPFALGGIGCNRVVTGKLSWYQPLNRCHWIAYLAMAIGVLNYPELDWRFVSGDIHTVPVGYGSDGEPKVVMDILLFDRMTAEQSIAHAKRKLENRPRRDGWQTAYRMYAKEIVPLIRASLGTANEYGHEHPRPFFRPAVRHCGSGDS